jgi:hypothetical protein
MSMTVIKTVTILELIRFRSSTGDTGLLISSGDSLSVTVTSLIRTCRGGFCPRRRRPGLIPCAPPRPTVPRTAGRGRRATS